MFYWQYKSQQVIYRVHANHFGQVELEYKFNNPFASLAPLQSQNSKIRNNSQ